MMACALDVVDVQCRRAYVRRATLAGRKQDLRDSRYVVDAGDDIFVLLETLDILSKKRLVKGNREKGNMSW